LEFNVPFQHKYGYIRDEPKTCNASICDRGITVPLPVMVINWDWRADVKGTKGNDIHSLKSHLVNEERMRYIEGFCQLESGRAFAHTKKICQITPQDPEGSSG